MKSIIKEEKQEWVGKGTVISLNGKKKKKTEEPQVTGAGVRRAEEDKAFGGVGHSMAKDVWAIGGRQRHQRLQQHAEGKRGCLRLHLACLLPFRQWRPGCPHIEAPQPVQPAQLKPSWDTWSTRDGHNGDFIDGASRPARGICVAAQPRNLRWSEPPLSTPTTTQSLLIYSSPPRQAKSLRDAGIHQNRRG